MFAARGVWERRSEKPAWSRSLENHLVARAPALQLLSVFRAATGRQMRRSPDGGIIIKSTVAAFG